MPQMAPISWLTLFIIFSITFLLFSIMNYYSMINKTLKSNNLNMNMFKKSMNWKW